MTRALIVPVTVAASAFALGGCASSFEAVDRSAAAFNQRMVDEKRCYSRPAPNGQTIAGCNFMTTTSDTNTTTTTVTTTDSEGRVTSTSTTRTVNGQEVPERR